MPLPAPNITAEFHMAPLGWFVWYHRIGRDLNDITAFVRRPIIGWVIKTKVWSSPNVEPEPYDGYAMVLSLGERNTSLVSALNWHTNDYHLIGVEWPGMTNVERNLLWTSFPQTPIPHTPSIINR